MATPVPFSQSPRYSQIAMAIKPEGMIADDVCPRIDVPSDKFIYTRLDHEDLFQLVDTSVGRKSEPNQVEFGATDITESVGDYALDDFVPNRDIKSAASSGGSYDPQAVAVEGTTILLLSSREKRVADKLFNLASYDANLRTTLSGTAQWSDVTSDPWNQIQDVIQNMLVSPNIAVFNKKSWRYLRSHPSIVAMALNRGVVPSGGTAAAGSLTKLQVAELFELDNIFVGESLFNAARKGQTASYTGLWGNHAAFLRIDKNVRAVHGMAMPTFAFTAQWGTRFSGTIPDAKTGIEGGNIVRVGEYVKELISCPQAGAFFQNVVN
jgi:hypothetical protein